jgi:ubiquinone/menaquinone biosynthesis C-methylase UbiE
MPRQPEPEYMDGAEEASAYAASDFSSVNQAFVDRLLELVGPDPASLAALDLGTGPGDIPIRLCLARPAWRVVAVDASEPMLAIARKAARQAKLSERIAFLRVDATRTGLPARSFDVLLSNSILHHLSSPADFWRELQRVGKPRAIVLLRDLYRPPSEDAARKIVATYAGVGPKRMQEDYYRSLLSSFTPEEVRAQLAQTGLASLKVEKITDRHLDVFGRLP